MAQPPDKVQPYAGEGGGPESGSQRLFEGGPNANLMPYGEANDPADDHSIPTSGMRVGTAGDHQRATDFDMVDPSGRVRASRNRGPMKPPSRYGVAGSDTTNQVGADGATDEQDWS